jgi:hypothetical protein
MTSSYHGFLRFVFIFLPLCPRLASFFPRGFPTKMHTFITSWLSCQSYSCLVTVDRVMRHYMCKDKITSNSITFVSNFMDIRYMFQNLGRIHKPVFCCGTRKNAKACDHSVDHTPHSTLNFISFLPYSQLHAVVTIVTLAKDCMWCNHNNPTIKQSQTIAMQGWKSCLQQTTLNLNHFKMVEDTGLKIITSRSIWMALPPYQISWKSTKRFKVISGGDTRREIDWWFDNHTFIFGK